MQYDNRCERFREDSVAKEPHRPSGSRQRGDFIFFSQVVPNEIPGKETIFYIISDNIVYLYVMHINSFQKKKKKKKSLKQISSGIQDDVEEEIEILLS